MPTPTPRDVHLDGALSQFSIAYRNESYIYDQIFPIVPVAKQTDFYFIFDKQAWFRDIVKQRAPGTRAQRADYTLSTASYVAINYALAKAVPDEVRANADSPLRPDVEATEFVTDALLRGVERRVATLVTASANWAYAASPTTQWTADTADPLGDIEAAINGVVSTIGRQANVGVMSWDVWRYLKNHPDLLDRVKYTRNGGVPMPSDLAGWFGLEKLLIGNSLYDSAIEGQTASMLYIWGDVFWVGYVAPNATLLTPSAGFTLQWGARESRRFREDQERQDVMEVSHYTDEVIAASDSGAIVYNAI